ncbi:polyhydroxyalkanoic acid system family protein [Sphingomonas sp. BT-65]|uniref:polyhydroxyalkanoic acid system family protein n=1 Tax=Sphingomonas sp. BT-65 TaxID=2989821 RepID=UPI0022363A60|nr:polyhydroxyalkanoic acid system family protein [Sphingomonas sp. BT-65]MCW4463393.1 polyhydroxyalkanoic acid system family protein [Sphingomonas sp. BT-65]
MTEPVIVDIPHKLGREGARARLAGGVGKIGQMFPGGGTVQESWQGDTLHFTVTAMGQSVASRLEVFDDRVHAEVDLPPMLALFAGKIREKLQKEAPKLLE